MSCTPECVAILAAHDKERRRALAERDEARAQVDSLETQVHDDGGFIDRMVNAEAEVETLRAKLARVEALRGTHTGGGSDLWVEMADLQSALAGPS